MISVNCGCGRPARYSLSGIPSCNKYKVCYTYEELEEIIEDLKSDLSHAKKLNDEYKNSFALIASASMINKGETL